MNQLIGERIGPYRIQAQLRRTGIAAPFKATDKERTVVIKLLPHYHAQRPGFFLEFRQQVEMLAELQHPRLLPILTCDQSGGMTYLALPYIPGGSLSDRLQKPLGLEETLRIIRPLVEVLELLHSGGVVHQGIKPNNILFSSDEVLLSDANVPLLLAGSSALRGAATAVGDPAYMAPEQVMGQAVNRRTDIYGLGIVVYRCLTGRLPFQAEVPLAISLQQLYDEPPPPSLVTPFIPPGGALEKALLRALAKKGSARYESVKEFIDALAAVSVHTGQEYVAAEVDKTAALPLEIEHQAAPVESLHPPAAEFISTDSLKSLLAEAASESVVCFRCESVNPASRKYCAVCGYNMTSKQAEEDKALGPDGQPLRARLFLSKYGPSGRELLLHQSVTTIGRISSNDIIILDATVSRRHARITFTGTDWQLEDAGSVNGTFVNGHRLTQPILLHHGDIIQFGEQEAAFRLGGRRAETLVPKK